MVETEIREILKRAVDDERLGSSLVKIANSIAPLTPKGISQTDSAILLREDRDR